MPASDHDDDRDDQTETLRRLISNAERLWRGAATPGRVRIEQRFKTFPALVDLNDTAVDDDYDTGEEDPVIEDWESARFVGDSTLR
jgi:hypothetical protein